MKKILWILLEITFDILRATGYFIKNNLRVFANLLDLLLPYVMYFVGQYVCKKFGYLNVGSEVMIPLGFVMIIYYLRSTANKLGKGITIPIPNKRFSKVDEDGEVTIENRRVPELILYIADLEDWLERKGLL